MADSFSVCVAASGKVIAESCVRASGFLERCRGLLGRSGLAPGEALLIEKCRMVHMFGMSFPIDAVFCSRENVIVSISKDLQPWQMSGYAQGASYVIELAAGTARAQNLQLGDRLLIGDKQKLDSTSACASQSTTID